MFDRADSSGSRTIELYGSRLTLPAERRFASVSSVQDYADRVLALNWVRAQWVRAAVPVVVRERRGTGAAHYEPAGATLAIPVRRTPGAEPWALRELVVLHELAHHLDPAPAAAAQHGPAFCGRYLALVEGVIGMEAELLLRATLRDTGARVS
jgi:putative metallohydrolase (TIGR04338 family)